MGLGEQPQGVAGEGSEGLPELRRLAAYFDLSADLLCETDGHGRIVRLNPAWEKSLGWSREEMLGRRFDEFVHPDDLAKTAEATALMERGHALDGFVNRFRRKGGGWRHLEWRSSPPLAGMNFGSARDVTNRVESQARLERSEQMFSQVFHMFPNPLSVSDDEGRLLDVNEALASLHGLSKADLVGRKSTEVGIWKDMGDRDRIVAKLAVEGKVDAEEVEMNGADGRLLNMLFYARKITVAGESLNLSVSLDITALRRTEKALRESEALFSAVFREFPDPISLMDRDNVVVDVNGALLERYGLRREEVVGHSTQDLALWTNASQRLAMVERAWREGRAADEEFVMRDGRGRLFTMLLSSQRIKANGRDLLLSVSFDVTALREAQRALARTQEQLLSVGQLAHIGYWSVDMKTGDITWSDEVYRIHGYDAATFKPTMDNVGAIFLPGEFDLFREALAELAAAGGRRRLELKAVRPNGEVRQCQIVANAAEPPSPDAGMVFGLTQDLTEMRRMEEERLKLEQQVMQAQKLESLGVLAGGIAHDFNNLLTSILGNADLALAEAGPGGALQARLGDIEQASQRAAELCRQMLAYSGRGHFEVRPLSMNDLVRDMARLLSVSISKKASLKYDLYEGLPTVMADATQMQQVVMNLITNASEALGDRNGTISMMTGVLDCDQAGIDAMGPAARELKPGRHVFLKVGDTGHGMSAETLERIFEPFFTTKFTGRGLGLAAVQGIVRGHHGALSVHSKPGQGTIFTIVLPALEGVWAEAKGVERPDPAWKGQGEVLVVDDEPGVLELGRRILEGAGFTVLTARDGREAVEVFRQRSGSVRLVVLDLTMPRMDGRACFTRLHEINPKARVLISSGYSAEEVDKRFGAGRLAGFVQKPFKVAGLLAAVRRALEP